MTVLDVPCPICNAPAGEQCAKLIGSFAPREPHARRERAALEAENAQLRDELARAKAQLTAIGGPLP